MRYLLPLQIVLSLLPLMAADIYQEKMNARIRTTYEVIPLSPTHDMGIIGTHFDWFPLDSFKPLYTSLGFLNAISGEEGGFFTFGYTIGVDYEFYDNLHIDSGIYVGGGSGTYINFPNGGMLVRSHAGFEYEIDNVDLVLGISRTDFPNTRSNKEFQTDYHPYIGMNFSNDIWSKTDSKGYSNKIATFDGIFQNLRISPSLMYFDVDDKVVKKDRHEGDEAYQESFPLVGIQFDKFITDNIFISFETYGALGSAAGYAAILAGLGYDYKLLDYLTWESKIIAGSAGDSRIDTGGGLLVQPMTGLRINLTPSVSLQALAGRTYAPDGLFSANAYQMALSFGTSNPKVKKGTYLFSSDAFENLQWVMSPSLKVYFPHDSTHKSTPEESEETISLVGIVMAVPLNDWVSIRGSTYWAMTGNIGSYAEGLFGAQLNSPKFTPLNIKANLMAEVGAGAGAGVNTSSGGFVTHYTAGLEIPMTKNTSLNLSAGHMETSDDKFKANSIVLAIDIKLNYLYAK